MSTAKDKARADAGNPHRNEPMGTEKRVKVKCFFPPCQQQIVIDEDKAPQPGKLYQGPPLMCQKHADMLNFMAWFMTNVKVQQQQTAGGLVLPGNKEFQTIVPQKGAKRP